MRKGFAIAALVAPQVLGAVALGQIDAAAVAGYVPGVVRDSGGDKVNNHQDPAAAVGGITRDAGTDDWGYDAGAVNPFSPPFAPGDIVIIGEGGRLTLELSREIPGNGRHLGVFVNNGYVDVSPGGTGQTGNPISTLSDPVFPRAVVSVSSDGIDWRPLNGGLAYTFTNPTNAFVDTQISSWVQPLGNVPANSSKPYLGSADDLAGKTYGQIRTEMNGSAGGNWLDLSSAGLPSVNYVRFDVPQGAGRMVVDAVSGLPAAQPVVVGERIISLSVGEGANTSNIVIDFGPQSYQFQVHYDEPMTGLAALQLLAAETDYELATQEFSFGTLVMGHDFGGYAITGDLIGDAFWNYFVGEGADWGFSGVGAGDRLLADGSFDGWVWTGGQDTPPDYPVAIPEPAMLSILMAGALLLRRRQ